MEEGRVATATYSTQLERRKGVMRARPRTCGKAPRPNDREFDHLDPPGKGFPLFSPFKGRTKSAATSFSTTDDPRSSPSIAAARRIPGMTVQGSKAVSENLVSAMTRLEEAMSRSMKMNEDFVEFVDRKVTTSKDKSGVPFEYCSEALQIWTQDTMRECLIQPQHDARGAPQPLQPVAAAVDYKKQYNFALKRMANMEAIVRTASSHVRYLVRRLNRSREREEVLEKQLAKVVEGEPSEEESSDEHTARRNSTKKRPQSSATTPPRSTPKPARQITEVPMQAVGRRSPDDIVDLTAPRMRSRRRILQRSRSNSSSSSSSKSDSPKYEVDSRQTEAWRRVVDKALGDPEANRFVLALTTDNNAELADMLIGALDKLGSAIVTNNKLETSLRQARETLAENAASQQAGNNQQGDPEVAAGSKEPGAHPTKDDPGRRGSGARKEAPNAVAILRSQVDTLQARLEKAKSAEESVVARSSRLARLCDEVLVGITSTMTLALEEDNAIKDIMYCIPTRTSVQELNLRIRKFEEDLDNLAMKIRPVSVDAVTAMRSLLRGAPLERDERFYTNKWNNIQAACARQRRREVGDLKDDKVMIELYMDEVERYRADVRKKLDEQENCSVDAEAQTDPPSVCDEALQTTAPANSPGQFLSVRFPSTSEQSAEGVSNVERKSTRSPNTPNSVVSPKQRREAEKRKEAEKTRPASIKTPLVPNQTSALLESTGEKLCELEDVPPPELATAALETPVEPDPPVDQHEDHEDVEVQESDGGGDEGAAEPSAGHKPHHRLPDIVKKLIECTAFTSNVFMCLLFGPIVPAKRPVPCGYLPTQLRPMDIKELRYYADVVAPMLDVCHVWHQAMPGLRIAEFSAFFSMVQRAFGHHTTGSKGVPRSLKIDEGTVGHRFSTFLHDIVGSRPRLSRSILQQLKMLDDCNAYSAKVNWRGLYRLHRLRLLKHLVFAVTQQKAAIDTITTNFFSVIHDEATAARQAASSAVRLAKDALWEALLSSLRQCNEELAKSGLPVDALQNMGPTTAAVLLSATKSHRQELEDANAVPTALDARWYATHAVNRFLDKRFAPLKAAGQPLIVGSSSSPAKKEQRRHTLLGGSCEKGVLEASTSIVDIGEVVRGLPIS